MYKKLAIFTLAILCVTGMAYANTVTTTDGKNFVVTNDAGFQVPYSMDQLTQTVAMTEQQAVSDAQRYLTSKQTALIWEQLLAGAQEALANYNKPPVTPKKPATPTTPTPKPTGT